MGLTFDFSKLKTLLLFLFRDFVRIAVRYSKFTELLAVLTQAIHCTSADDENTTFFNELIKKMPGPIQE